MADTALIQKAQDDVVRAVVASVPDVMDGEWGEREWKRLAINVEIDSDGGRQISSQTSAIAAAPGQPVEDVDFRLSREAKDALVTLRELMADDRGHWSTVDLRIEPDGTFAFEFDYGAPRRLGGDLLHSPLDGELDRYRAETSGR